MLRSEGLGFFCSLGVPLFCVNRYLCEQILLLAIKCDGLKVVEGKLSDLSCNKGLI